MIKIGVICPSEIAFRRFMPAILKNERFKCVGYGICTPEERFGSKQPDEAIAAVILKAEYEKAQKFVEAYGGKIFNGYETIVTSDEIDAIYIPLPPALHFKWAKLALENNKHVMVEKPATLSHAETKHLTNLAKRNKLGFHENYMFAFHKQIKEIQNMIENKEVGDGRLYRISFGFPRRALDDFRYNRKMGGGALIDAGGYTLKYASMILGESAKILYANSNYITDFDVDIYGSGALGNAKGDIVQIAFGMDNNYKCELEVWGSQGCITTGRVLTAPAGFEPIVIVTKGNEQEVKKLSADDAFEKSIDYFFQTIVDESARIESCEQVEKQALLVDEFRNQAKEVVQKG